jgi:hypothetical protein
MTTPGRLSRGAAVASLLLLVVPAHVVARQTTRLDARFEPDRPGRDTTIAVGFRISTPTGALPSPLVGIGLLLPAGTFSVQNSLGSRTCDPRALEETGPGACPANAVMGHGSAMVGVPFGPRILYERTRLTLLMLPLEGGHTTVAFYAEGSAPVITQLVFPGRLLGSSGPFGSLLQTTIPLVSGLPGGPGVALVSLRATIGPRGLTYYRQTHGQSIPYSPKGFVVPPVCPGGGYPFAMSFSFANGTKESAHTSVPCHGS